MTGPRQLAFALPSRPALGRAAFFAAASNRLALASVDRWPDWPGRRLALVGPEGSGKTHLAHVWAARAGARIMPASALTRIDPGAAPEDGALVVEDGDRIPALDGAAGAAEAALLHLANRLQAGGGSLMVTGRAAPAHWAVALPDLASRLQAVPVAKLEPPDDALLAAVLVKLFADRGVLVGPEVVRYLAARIDRSFAAIEDVVSRLDGLGLARGRPVTVRLAGELLAEGAG